MYYVKCHECFSLDTILKEEAPFLFVNCNNCGTSSSVMTIKDLRTHFYVKGISSERNFVMVEVSSDESTDSEDFE